MRLAFHIALRYLFARKSHTVINIISMISVAGVMVGTMALVVVLSVFNGFEALIGQSYSAFNPDLKIIPANGKVFEYTPRIDSILMANDVKQWSKVIEDQAFARYGDKQTPIIVKGVDEHFGNVSGLDTMMVEGQFTFWNGQKATAVVGYGLVRTLRIGLKFVTPLVIHVPRRDKNVSMSNPQSNFKSDYLYPSGVFLVHQPEFDQNYVLIPIEEAQKLFAYDKQVSHLELKVGDDANEVKAFLKDALGGELKVLDRYEQQADFYKMMNIEKWMTFLILMFILFIATFNIIGSLSMLMIDKKDNIGTLINMGAGSKLIRMIFVFEGWIISLAGTLGGLLLGASLTFLQMKFGLLRLGGNGSFIVDAYPVHIQVLDFVLVFMAVTILGFLASWYPVRRITTKVLG